MPIETVCHKDVVTVSPNDSVTNAANLMRGKNVGCLVAVNSRKNVLGILTDRDIVLEVVAKDLKSDDILVEDIMMRHPVTVVEGADIYEAITVMQEHSVKRLPVVDIDGRLKGIIAADDIYEWLSKEFGSVAEITRTQIAREKGGSSLAERF